MKFFLSAEGIGSNPHWKGWLKGFGDAAPIAQSLLTILGGIATGIILIFLVWKAIMLGVSFSKAEGPEERRQLKTQSVWFIGGMVIIVVGSTVTLALFTTIGKAVRVQSPTEESLIASLFTTHLPRLSIHYPLLVI